jgi:phenylpropionate dioxygenase-like ring-hydroxylating dioxygenase large terminal subunit
MSTTVPRLPRATETELVGRVFAQHAARTTTLAAAGTRVPANRYVSAEQLQREQRTVFRHEPVFACLSVDVARPGDRFTFESGGVPVVIVRAADGALRAYVNVCRHRAAPLVRECGAGERSFVCPFHGWVYDTADGRLLGQPRSCDGFDAVSDAELALLPLAVAEAHGIVVVRPGGTASIDVDEWLDGLGADFAGLGYATVLPYRRAREEWRCNWKLLIDTFLESYHVPALHKASLGAAYIGAASPFDAFGRHNRIVVPQAAILDQASRAPEEWDLLAASVLQYFLAPNVIFSNLQGYVMTWRFVPLAPDRCAVEHALYTYRSPDTPEDRAHFDARFEAARNVTRLEDFPESELVHHALASGTVDATVIGRNEPGVVHFHDMLRDATTP